MLLKKIIFYILSFAFLICSFCYSESSEKTRYIRVIAYRGNRVINESKLAEITGIRPGQAFDPKSIENSLSRILDEYKKLGYFFSKINWEYGDFEKDQIIIKVYIQEGELTRIGKLEFSGNKLLSKEQLLKFLEFREGDIFYESKLQKGLGKLLDQYSYKGYPMAKFSPSEFRLEDNRIFFKIIIDEGPLVKIHQIRIDGLKKTREEVVLRELSIKPGNVFDQRQIDESKRKIINLGYFQNVQESFSQGYDNNVIIDFSVRESRTGQFMGVLGYNPSENNLYGDKFTGMLEAIENNIFGTGRKVALRGKLGPVDSYELSYIEPWVFDAPLDIGIHLWGVRREPNESKQENPSNFEPSEERAASLSGTLRTFKSIESSLALTYKRIKSPVKAHQFPEEPYMVSGNKYSLTLSAKRDTRDYFINPSTGRLLHSAFEISRGDFRIFKWWIDLSQYLKIWQNQVFVVSLHGGRVWGQLIPITELMYLGGANTLRGYTEDFFRGEGRIYANFEYRFLVSRDSQFFLFLDSGTIYSKDEGMIPPKSGYGIGMRLRSETGIISMDYGLARGDSILGGKIHVSLGAKY